MKFYRFILFFSDSMFFIFIYLGIIKLTGRPQIPLIAILIFFIFLLTFWIHRFYEIEIFFNRDLYFFKLIKVNVISFILFWGIWWVFLKSQWPIASRLVIILLFVIFGSLYYLTLRIFIGSLLLKRTNIYLFLTPKHRRLYKGKLQKYGKKPVELKKFEDIKTKLKKGLLLISYFPSDKVKTRADMWEDYFSQIFNTKNAIAGKKVKVLFFNIYNSELQIENLSTVFLGKIPSISVSPPSKSLYTSFFKRIFDISFSILMFPLISALSFILYFAIKLKLGSPVVFKQIRVGKDLEI